MQLPNFYFHLTHAYAILRHNGVELQKLDFWGHSPRATETSAPIPSKGRLLCTPDSSESTY